MNVPNKTMFPDDNITVPTFNGEKTFSDEVTEPRFIGETMLSDDDITIPRSMERKPFQMRLLNRGSLERQCYQMMILLYRHSMERKPFQMRLLNRGSLERKRGVAKSFKDCLKKNVRNAKREGVANDFNACLTNNVRKRLVWFDGIVGWYGLTGCPTVALMLLEGNVIYSGPPALKAFGENALVKEAFLALIPNAKTVLESYDYKIQEGWETLNIHKKRKLVVNIVTHNGTKQPKWADKGHKPHWWPSNIPFGDPNNGQNRPGAESLNQIISAAHNAFGDDDDDDDDDDR